MPSYDLSERFWLWSDTDGDFRMKTFPVLTARREREKVLRGGKVEDEREP